MEHIIGLNFKAEDPLHSINKAPSKFEILNCVAMYYRVQIIFITLTLYDAFLTSLFKNVIYM